MQKAIYFSQTTGAERRINVYTPPGYRTDRTYPVLYVLHGIGGTENEWLENADPRALLDAEIQAGRARPMIVVFANGRAMVPDSVPSNVFSPEAIQAFARFERDLSDDLIPFVEKTFPTARDRNHRALCGLSMGGGQSLNIGVARPELFSAIGAFSAAPNTDVSAVHQGQALPLIWMVCGQSDGLLNVSVQADETFTRHQIEHSFEIIPGDHDWNVWTYGLRQFVAKIFTEAR